METLLLRPWKDDDLAPFQEMNFDPEVMRHFPALLTPAESAAIFAGLRRTLDKRGWGLWAVEIDGTFAGFTGLNIPDFSAPFTPCIEIGWRFRREFWGRGLATRAAEEALRYGFDTLSLHEVVAFTASTNTRSWRLMERLGFERDLEGDFDHPALPEHHVLRRHVLYRKRSDKPIGIGSQA